MAFRKELWKRIGGFPETVFFGEDTLFDLEARRLTPPAFVAGAKAIYRPQYNFVQPSTSSPVTPSAMASSVFVAHACSAMPPDALFKFWPCSACS